MPTRSMCPGTIPRRRFGQLHGSPTRLAWVGHRPCGVTQMIGAPATGNGRSPVVCGACASRGWWQQRSRRRCQPETARLARAFGAAPSSRLPSTLARQTPRHDRTLPQITTLHCDFSHLQHDFVSATNGRPAREVRTGLFSIPMTAGRSRATSTIRAVGAGTPTNLCSVEPRGSPDRRKPAVPEPLLAAWGLGSSPEAGSP